MKPKWDLTGTVMRFFPGGAIIFHLDGKKIVSNDNLTRMCGFDPMDIVDFNDFNNMPFFDENNQRIINDIFRNSLHGKTNKPTEVQFHRLDGRLLHLELLCGPILDNEGKFAAVYILAFDISKRKLDDKEREEMRLEYLSASRMATLGELARGIAHKINNPLAGLFGYLEMLAEDYPDDDRIEKCITQCKRIGDIAANMSYHGRNTEFHESTRVDINELVAETLMLISASKLYDNLRIETDLMDLPPIVIFNPGDLTQVLLNLLRNARDAVWDNNSGIITVRTSMGDNEMVLSVSDNGTGIPEDIREKIFQPFFTTKAREPQPDSSPVGNGLGLSTSKHLIDQNDGSMDFTTDAGKGTTFNVYLPLQ